MPHLPNDFSTSEVYENGDVVVYALGNGNNPVAKSNVYMMVGQMVLVMVLAMAMVLGMVMVLVMVLVLAMVLVMVMVLEMAMVMVMV